MSARKDRHADLDRRALDPAGEVERLLEVLARSRQVQRPQLGDAEVHERGRAVGLGAPELARELRLQRGFDGARGDRHRRDVAAGGGEPERGPGQRQVERGPPVGGHRRRQALGAGEMRGGLLVQAVARRASWRR